MTPIRRVASAQLATGWLLTRHPSRALRLLDYPHDRALARGAMRVLGLRQLIQGSIGLRGGPTTMWAGAGVDAVHALTCLAYAHRTKNGRQAGLRSAAV